MLRSLSGLWADRYAGEVLLPALARAVGLEGPNVASLRDRLNDPYHCLEAIYCHYAFARRGGDRHELSSLAVQALARTCDPTSVHQLLSQPDARILWGNFCELCEERHRRPLEQLNRGIVAGLAELAQEIYRLDGCGSIARWVVEGVLSSGRVESEFFRMVEVRGVGPKLASVFLRDLVFLHHLEDRLHLADRIYIQPIDKWTRLIAPHVVPELDGVEAPDWIIAGKIAKTARRAGISGVRFNMGASYFGCREVRVPEALEPRLQTLLGSPRMR